MTDPYSILFGLVILAASAWLFWLGAGPKDPHGNPIDEEFWEQRRRRRHWVSGMIAAIGICAVGAGCFGMGHAWMILWAVTPVFLFGVIGIALFDAFFTSQHVQRRLQDQSRRMVEALKNDDKR